MRVVCAPDSFKGSLDASGVVEALSTGLKASLPGVDVVSHPLADGGEGTLEILSHHGFDLHERAIHDQLGRELRGAFGLRGDLAVVESAVACGFDPHATAADALAASSFGVGELILHALEAGATNVLLTLGGTASTDGGVGMAEALGFRFLDAAGGSIPRGGAGLRVLERIDRTHADARIAQVAFTALTDVDNPLCGPRGAAAVFAPQKGADDAAVALLEEGLTRLVSVSASALATRAGSGAAGGLGFGAMEFLGASATSGAKAMMDITHFDEALEGADLVITGEGSFDDQSLQGKIPFEVIKRARDKGIPVAVVCGVNGVSDDDALGPWGIQHIWSLSDIEPNRSASIANAGALLERIGSEIGASLASQ